MTFEDAIAALVEVSSEDGDFEPVDVTLTYEPEGEVLLVSVDVGAVDPEDGDEPLLKMLEANHMFSGTMGASFCVDDGIAKLQRRIRLDAFWREGGKAILTSLFKSVQDWRQRREE